MTRVAGCEWLNTKNQIVTRAFRLFCLVVLICAAVTTARAQSETATISGLVTDEGGGMVPNCEVVLQSVERGTLITSKTNGAGIYVFASVPPGQYNLTIKRSGFKQVDFLGLIVNVQDHVEQNFRLQVGSVSESVTVTASDLHINTTDASVSTVIDRNFVSQLPLNGRSFNTLLELTPGVVIAPTTSQGGGQFSISGQRTDANSFTVDGVSVNFGVGAAGLPGETGTGGAQAFSVLGATGSLVSVDALQEFRIETSSFAPEFGKTPGGQVILTTRSGTNDFHGGVFDYFRNTVMDANDWFANQAGNPRAAEQHNDFGGFLGGRIWRDRTFFFFSYEGARLRLPQTIVSPVPSKGARGSAPATLAPYLNAYPLPTGPETLVPCDPSTDPSCPSSGQKPSGVAPLTGTLSHPATLDATSIRIDHSFSSRFTIFGRYNYAPSEAQQAFGPSTSLSNPTNTNVNTQTVTVGLNTLLRPNTLNVIRVNYSVQSNTLSNSLDSFGGAVPLNPNLLLGGLDPTQNSGFFQTFDIAAYTVGFGGRSRARQINFTDGLSLGVGSHQLKFGGDYRAIFLDQNPAQNSLSYFASDVPTFISSNGSMSLNALGFRPSQFLVHSLSIFAQDTWKLTPRLTFTYGVRWELSPPPSPRGNTTLAAWQNVDDPAKTALAPPGTPLWATTYGNFAPRFGLAYSLTSNGDFVVRAGAGTFYDLGQGGAANLSVVSTINGGFAFNSVTVPVTDVSPFLATLSRQPPWGGAGFDPHLTLPRSYQWNVALEKSFAGKQAITATYVGQAGRDLLRSKAIFQPNSNFLGSDLLLTQNSAYSNYHALQVQFRKTLSSRLQALLNYTWSHSLDNASNDVVSALPSNVLSGASDYASSDFDVRHSFSGAISYDVPAVAKSGALALLTGHWSIQSVIVARSGLPFNAEILRVSPDPTGNAPSRPDLVPGQPLWIANSAAGGGKSLNPSAFSIPSPPRQGTEGRNDIPGFGLTQVDFSIGRAFPISERVKLQFRADAFNLLNHPNFRNPAGFVEFGTFGLKSSEMLNQALGAGGLSPLFQQGGPRSLQLSLKLSF